MTVVLDEAFWVSTRPDQVTHEVDFTRYESLLEVFETACRNHRNKPAFSNLGQVITFGDLDRLSANFASFLQNQTELNVGDRVAIQLPNILQYPIVLFAILRAGMVVVNTNPLYTPREMKHQFCDADAKGLVALANFGDKIETVLPETSIHTLVITELGDALPPLKRILVNSLVKHVKKMVPKYKLPKAITYNRVMALGKRKTFKPSFKAKAKDLAVLQYTGGTTGVAKGAMLSHGNLVSNMMQMKSMLSIFETGQETIVAPLPMYHIFCFVVNCLASIEMGSHSVLITNPRDIPGFVKILKKTKFTAFAGLNTLFVALMKHPDFKEVDFSGLKLTISGGMALQSSVAKDWKDLTGCEICEGYGMTETSPVITVNPPSAIKIGTIGVPVPGTQVKVVDEDGKSLGLDEPGELCVKGPQVMQGYWQRPEATQKTMTQDGWLKTGDVALVQPDGYLRIVDRKKDMIIVSGFNVYPNELEDVIAAHPDVVECAVVGVEDDKSGESVKAFVVRSSDTLTAKKLKAYCKENMTAYKVPKHYEFRKELPKSNVGKILRRELREQQTPEV